MDRQPQPNIDRLLSNREASQLLGLSERYLWTLRQRGELTFLRVGNRIKYRIQDLRKWAEQRLQNV